VERRAPKPLASLSLIRTPTGVTSFKGYFQVDLFVKMLSKMSNCVIYTHGNNQWTWPKCITLTAWAETPQRHIGGPVAESPNCSVNTMVVALHSAHPAPSHNTRRRPQEDSRTEIRQAEPSGTSYLWCQTQLLDTVNVRRL
jgi:hypothetical protein